MALTHTQERVANAPRAQGGTDSKMFSEQRMNSSPDDSHLLMITSLPEDGLPYNHNLLQSAPGLPRPRPVPFSLSEFSPTGPGVAAFSNGVLGFDDPIFPMSWKTAFQY